MAHSAESALLLSEAEWLERAHANSADKGYSAEYRRGFAAAAGWVRFHAEHPHLTRREQAMTEGHTTDIDALRPAFGEPVSDWFRWFAWRPVETADRGRRWLRPVWRRRIQKHSYLDGGPDFWFQQTCVIPPDQGE